MADRALLPKKKVAPLWIHSSIILLLVLFWVFGAIFLNPLVNITTLVQDQQSAGTGNTKTSPLLAHQTITGEFRANENDLGTVLVRFTTFNQVNTDLVTFQVKEKGANSWYYQQTYRVDQFQDNQFFPFGFPIIQNSQGKNYVFSITSLKGKKHNAVALSSITPQLQLKYQFSKQALLHDPNLLLHFLIAKMYNTFTTPEILAASFYWLFPLLLYLIFLLVSKYAIRDSLLVIFYFILILLTILFIQILTIQPVIIFMAGVWLVLSYRYRFDSSVSYLFAVLLLLLCPIFIVFGQQLLAEKTANWVYVFLVIGLVISCIELLWKPKNSIGYKTVCLRILKPIPGSERMIKKLSD